jgi:transcriptional regulator with XRE-family HTH domain
MLSRGGAGLRLSRPHRQRRVAFLPGVPVRLKGLKSKDWIDQPATLGEHLKKRRRKLRLLQRQAAEKLGVSVDTYRGWEKGRIEPYTPAWTAIIAFLGYDPNPAPRTMGERLRAARRTLGWTERRAADHLGWDPTTIYRYERGNRMPTGDRLDQLRAFLNSCSDGPFGSILDTRRSRRPRK